MHQTALDAGGFVSTHGIKATHQLVSSLKSICIFSISGEILLDPDQWIPAYPYALFDMFKSVDKHSSCRGNDRADDRFAIEGTRFPEISGVERAELLTLANALRAENSRLDRTAVFGADVQKGCGKGPAIIFGDSSEIPLVSHADGHQLEYRMGYLANDGDLMIIAGRDCRTFESYQKRVLGLTTLEYLTIKRQTKRSAPGYCLRDEAVFENLRDFVRKNGGVTFVSYLTTAATWALASRLANETQCPVFVAGPPGGLSNYANNKLWFANAVGRLLGSEAMPPKRAAHGAAALVRHVMELTLKWPKLVLKVPNSAGSAGNYVVYSNDIKGMKAKAVDGYLRNRLRHLGWPGRFPLAVEVWDANVLTSPSVQLWVPRSSDGDPVVEGVFEQLLVGEEGTFAGAAPADLPSRVDSGLCAQAFRIALLFQHLGYYGRCSMDAVLSGSKLDRSVIHWIECNARWGGVSIPMSLLKRTNITVDYTITQATDLQNSPRSFEAACTEFDDIALSQDRQHGIIFLNPNGIEEGTGCQFVALGQTRKETIALSKHLYERLQQKPISTEAVSTVSVSNNLGS